MGALSSYLARRTAQKERVRILYRRALKDNSQLGRPSSSLLSRYIREKFEANKHVEDLERIDRMIADGEATYNKWRHPDPYIVPWAPGGSKFTRNLTPLSGIEIVYDYGREDNDCIYCSLRWQIKIEKLCDCVEEDSGSSCLCYSSEKKCQLSTFCDALFCFWFCSDFSEKLSLRNLCPIYSPYLHLSDS